MRGRNCSRRINNDEMNTTRNREEKYKPARKERRRKKWWWRWWHRLDALIALSWIFILTLLLNYTLVLRRRCQCHSSKEFTDSSLITKWANRKYTWAVLSSLPLSTCFPDPVTAVNDSRDTPENERILRILTYHRNFCCSSNRFVVVESRTDLSCHFW